MAGRDSGERVWPFPLDKDFDETLKSDIADTLQCSLEGEADHILATRFLNRFVVGATNSRFRAPDAVSAPVTARSRPCSPVSSGTMLAVYEPWPAARLSFTPSLAD